MELTKLTSHIAQPNQVQAVNQLSYCPKLIMAREDCLLVNRNTFESSFI